MKRNVGIFGVTLATLSITAIVAGSARAATWQWVGTSGLAGELGNPMQDFQRIKFNAVATDAAGNTYVTAVRNFNYGSWTDSGTPSNYADDYFTRDAGGYTIFKPDGSKLDVDLAPVSGLRGTGGVGGLPGGITKLVRAGDGKVYALQNWYQIQWTFALPYMLNSGDTYTCTSATVNNHLPDRIMRLNPDGTINVVVEYPVVVDSCSNGNHINRITGMDVGADGNIYWTMNAANSYWKVHFFWRYRIADGVIEEAPHGGVNDGMSETHKMFDLIHVGTYVGDVTTDWFTVIGILGSTQYAADAMSWPNARGPVTPNASNGASTSWGRDWVTATAYDVQRRKLWVGGRGINGTNYWPNYTGDSSAPSGGTTTFVDLGGGNWGMRMTNTAARQYTWRRTDLGAAPYNATEATIGASFVPENIPSNYYGTIMFVHPVKWAPHVGIMIRDNGNGLRYYLYEMGDYGFETQLYDIAPYVQNQTEQAHIYVKGGTLASGSTDGTVKLYWGVSTTPVFTKTDANANGNNTDVGFGVTLYRPYGTPTSKWVSGTIRYDWVGVDKADHAPGAAWPTQGPGSGGILACYLDGSYAPSDYEQTCVMSRWDGDPYITSGARYDSPFSLQTGIGSNIAWHANGNDPKDTNVRNGRYWVSAIAIQPTTGNAWITWGANRATSYAPGLAYPQFTGTFTNVGEVFWVGPDASGLGGSEGVPQAFHPDPAKAAHASQITAMTTATKWIYAETFDLTTGEYNLFRTPSGVCHTPPQDLEADGDVDLTDFSAFQLCFNGPNQMWATSLPEAVCACLDTDDDADVDLSDFSAFAGCFNGPNNPPACQ